MDNDLDFELQEWPNNTTLLKLKSKVTQDQIALVNLAKRNGLHHEIVKKRQTKLLRSLRFRTIAVSKIFKSYRVKAPEISNTNFTWDLSVNKKKYWDIIKELKVITSDPEKYESSPVKKIWIPKSQNKKMPIWIFTITNKILQQLICLVLEPLVELTSDFNSFGFRKYRNPKMAIGVLKGYLGTSSKNYTKVSLCRKNKRSVPSELGQKKWILDADVANFFNSIHNKYLLNHLFLPSSGIQLVKKLLTSEIREKQICIISDEGVPQGEILFSVLANFTLNGLENTVRSSSHFTTESKTK